MDDVGNTYIFNAICSTTRYCELFAVEAANSSSGSLPVAYFGSFQARFRLVRSDRGTNFINAVFEEMLRIFEIQSILTLAQRPQANALAKYNGGEVMRHLCSILLDKELRQLWSVVLHADH